MAADQRPVGWVSLAEWQPRYAEVRGPEFHSRGSTRSLPIKGYLNVSLKGSRTLVEKFGVSSAFGIPLSRSKITVLDVDTPDENVLADAMMRCGRSPFIVRSGSGNWQVWYRNSGEGRHIRPDAAMPVDILGAGYVVAPPSKVSNGTYALIEGSLADIPSLPPMDSSGWSKTPTYNCTPSPLALRALDGIGPGERNSALWRHLMIHAPYCDDADALIDVARTAASAFSSPMSDDEVVKTALSAWKYEADGKNWIARGKRRPEPTEPEGLIWINPDAFLLWKVLRHFNGGSRPLLCGEHDGGDDARGRLAAEAFSAARKVPMDHGHVYPTSSRPYRVCRGLCLGARMNLIGPRGDVLGAIGDAPMSAVTQPHRDLAVSCQRTAGAAETGKGAAGLPYHRLEGACSLLERRARSLRVTNWSMDDPLIYASAALVLA